MPAVFDFFKRLGRIRLGQTTENLSEIKNEAIRRTSVLYRAWGRALMRYLRLFRIIVRRAYNGAVRYRRTFGKSGYNRMHYRVKLQITNYGPEGFMTLLPLPLAPSPCSRELTAYNVHAAILGVSTVFERADSRIASLRIQAYAYLYVVLSCIDSRGYRSLNPVLSCGDYPAFQLSTERNVSSSFAVFALNADTKREVLYTTPSWALYFEFLGSGTRYDFQCALTIY